MMRRHDLQRVAGIGLTAAAVALLAAAVGVSSSYFTDWHAGSIGGTNGATPLQASAHITPQTIQLSAGGAVNVHVAGLPDPHAVTQIVGSSVQLCFGGHCIANTGFTLLNDRTQLQARFDRGQLGTLAGTHRGRMTFEVTGALSGYAGGFVAQANATLTGNTSGPASTPAPAGIAPVSPSASAAASASASPTPTSAAPPTTTQSPSPSASPTLTPDSSPSPSPSASPTPATTPTPAASRTPSPSPSPTDSPTPDGTPSPTAVPTPTATPRAS